MTNGDDRVAALQPWGSNSDIPEQAHIVTTYDDFRKWVAKWAEGLYSETLVIVGAAGIGKTETAMEMLQGVPHLFVAGDATKYGLYMSLAHHIDEPVVLDDVDTLIKDQSVTSILKMLLNTRNPKRINWISGRTLSEDSNVPPEIITNSRSIILCNELKSVGKNFQAVLDRAVILWFRPTADEIHKYVGTWFDLKNHKDVYDYIGKKIHLSPSPSCRAYFKTKTVKIAELDWQAAADSMLRLSDANPKAVLVKELLHDPNLKTDKERFKVWNEKTGESLQSYYAHKRAVAVVGGGTLPKSGKEIGKGMEQRNRCLTEIAEALSISKKDALAKIKAKKINLRKLRFDSKAALTALAKKGK